MATIYTKKRVFTVSTAVMKFVRQAAADPNNDMGVDRILVLNTAEPTVPPAYTEIAAIVISSEFVGIAGSEQGGGVHW